MRRLLTEPIPSYRPSLSGRWIIAEVKNRPDVEVVEVTRGNRDTLPGQIAAWVNDSGSGVIEEAKC